MARIWEHHSNIKTCSAPLIPWAAGKEQSHLFGGVDVRLAVQTAYPPPLLGLVVCSLQRGLPLEGGTVAGL